MAGDPRGFAPLEPARHRVGERTELYDGTVTVDHWFSVPIDHALGLAEAEAQDAADAARRETDPSNPPPSTTSVPASA